MCAFIDRENTERRYTKRCWRCNSPNTFITTPLPYDEDDIIYVACCRQCTSWSFVREPKTIQRIERMLRNQRYHIHKQLEEDIDDSNEAPEFTMDFTQTVDFE